eukprot:13709308-Alexandrium_andersonii.AAC.1
MGLFEVLNIPEVASPDISEPLRPCDPFLPIEAVSRNWRVLRYASEASTLRGVAVAVRTP